MAKPSLLGGVVVPEELEMAVGGRRIIPLAKQEVKWRSDFRTILLLCPRESTIGIGMAAYEVGFDDFLGRSTSGEVKFNGDGGNSSGMGLGGFGELGMMVAGSGGGVGFGLLDMDCFGDGQWCMVGGGVNRNCLDYDGGGVWSWMGCGVRMNLKGWGVAWDVGWNGTRIVFCGSGDLMRFVGVACSGGGSLMLLQHLDFGKFNSMELDLAKPQSVEIVFGGGKSMACSRCMCVIMLWWIHWWKGRKRLVDELIWSYRFLVGSIGVSSTGQKLKKRAAEDMETTPDEEEGGNPSRFQG